MRALTCKAWGPIADLVIEEWDDPVPDDEELVIDIRAAGINYPDILIIAGKYQDTVIALPPELSFERAFQLLSERRALGKVVLRVTDAQ